VKTWDGVSTYEDYLSNNVGEDATKDVLFKILVKGKWMKHNGVYELHIYNGTIQGYLKLR
jgi:hypothetical protein